MNSQQLMLARAILRNALARRNYASYSKRHHPTSTFNDLPVPSGDFFALNAARQRKYNSILGVGVVSVVASLWAWTQSGLVTTNWGPPETFE